MAVYYKFKSAKEYDSVVIDGHFISVGQLKEKIFELKHLGRGTDFDLVVTNAQTNEEYLDEGALIPKNTSVLIRRVPGCPRMLIVTAPVTELEEPIVENNIGNVQPSKDTFAGTESSTAKYAADVDWDEFGNDLYAIPESVPVRSSIPVQDAAPVNKENEDEDSMIKALIDTPALDWQSQPSNGFGSGRGFGRGTGGRMMGGRGFDRGGFESKNPPPGYICHRCKVPGHFIHHCPTNGDPTFDLRRVKPPTGIPRSMLMATPDGSYALPSGAVAVLKPNEAAFEREIEGMPSTRSVGELPPELHCPVCKEVMKDAVLTSKCCFTSFCDRCIRDYIISKSMCVCGATNVLADDLLPNKTLRDTINRILGSNDSSAEKGGSAFQVQDMESRIPQAKAPSPTQSAALKGHQMSAQPVQREETSKISEGVEENIATNACQKQENGTTPKIPDVLEATHEVKSFREATSQGSAQFVDEEVQQKPISGEEGKKKKKEKICMPPGEMQWRPGQDLAPANYMMPPPLGPSAFNPYLNGMPLGLDSGFMPPYPGPMPYMGGYGFGGPMDVPFGFMPPQDPFGGMGGMMPYGPPPPHRDLAELAMGFNPGPPNMSREEFVAREAHKMKRAHEMERRGEREMSRDHQDYGRKANLRKEISKDRNYKDQDYYGREESSKVDIPPMKSKSKSTLPSNVADRRTRDPELPRPSSKRKSADYDHSPEEELRHQRRHRSSQKRRSESPSEILAAADKKQKASVFSRISFPGKDSSKKLSSSSGSAGNRVDGSNWYYEEKQKVVKRSSVSVDYESSDDERHFKRRRPSKHASSSPPPQVENHSRGHSKCR